MTRKRSDEAIQKEIVKEIESRLDGHEFIFDGKWDDQDDDFDVNFIRNQGDRLIVYGKRVDGGEIRFEINVRNIKIKEGTE